MKTRLRQRARFLTLAVLGFSACSPSAPSSSEAGRPVGFFYSLKADFKLKETGETVSFDYVVACNYTAFENIHTTDTAFTALAPEMMYQPAGDRHAIAITTIDMCEGDRWEPYTSDPQKGQERIPEDLRPLAIWFDDIEDLSQGWGYKTDDAYESPLAKIEFVGASVEKATLEEWKA
ncbi:hypothetical protein [Henriciella sp.]|uniref:hypothetical protein n=1 Tax=Henriciella sp. TaxID=1968823 RepID=UPI0026140F14|nr:hypothetical protein [Henriciella sp.]